MLRLIFHCHNNCCLEDRNWSSQQTLKSCNHHRKVSSKSVSVSTLSGAWNDLLLRCNCRRLCRLSLWAHPWQRMWPRSPHWATKLQVYHSYCSHHFLFSLVNVPLSWSLTDCSCRLSFADVQRLIEQPLLLTFSLSGYATSTFRLAEMRRKISLL